jgi:hypothetical protein
MIQANQGQAAKFYAYQQYKDDKTGGNAVLQNLDPPQLSTAKNICEVVKKLESIGLPVSGVYTLPPDSRPDQVSRYEELIQQHAQDLENLASAPQDQYLGFLIEVGKPEERGYVAVVRDSNGTFRARFKVAMVLKEGREKAHEYFTKIVDILRNNAWDYYPASLISFREIPP